jgi:YspA, cpYpsA-related SLOG family
LRVIVTGSRAWPDPMIVARELTKLYLQHGPFVLVHGACATGADAAAAHWYEVAGRELGCLELRHPAQWFAADGTTVDRSAGPRRNAEMVKAGADLVLAFPLFDSKGTKHTIELAEQAGIPVKKVIA